MGIHDRDWYQEWWKKKMGYTERADFRVPESEFRARKTPSPWPRAVFKTTVHLLAIFGFLTLVKKYLVPLL